MSRHRSGKTWPLVIGGLIALTMLARYSGACRRRAREESEDGDGV
ncbi:MAG TPA: hypothetical protein VI876_09100 [Dehalococcoidia bacterium]|nr:hypothetical protein [Dehalococcoidia bacterium]